MDDRRIHQGRFPLSLPQRAGRTGKIASDKAGKVALENRLNSILPSLRQEKHKAPAEVPKRVGKQAIPRHDS